MEIWKDILSGVPHGLILDPLLFNLFNIYNIYIYIKYLIYIYIYIFHIYDSMMNLFMLILGILPMRHYLILLRKVKTFLNV